MNDETLRDILRKGDPAAGDPGLAPEEVQAMRRTVLSAAPEPRRRGLLVPALAGAAALIVAVVVVSSLRPEPSQEAVGERSPLPLAGEGRAEGSVVVEKTPPHRPSAGPPAAQEREPPPAPRKKIVRSEPEPVILARAEPPALPEAPEDQTQIQFSTPGGTRVIWVLHPTAE